MLASSRLARATHRIICGVVVVVVVVAAAAAAVVVLRDYGLLTWRLIT